MKFITIASSRFVLLAQRLLISLSKSGTPVDLTIFCDDAELFEPLRRLGRCEIRTLPEILTLGAKRAKFTAYTQALAEYGDVIYLDSDIIALADLSALAIPGRLRASPDDLSACTFIVDPRHPWPGDPGLANECYVNSGVLHIPAALSSFFEHLRNLSLSEESWRRHIFPGKLYDNHFLCAHLNIERIEVDLLDAEQYNWQGFLKKGDLQVVRIGEELVNRITGRPLKLAHFAGVADLDATLCSLPVDVASLLCERSTAGFGTPTHEFARFQASLSGYFRAPLCDDFVKTTFEHVRSELLTIADSGWSRDFQRRDSYLRDATSLISLAYSRPTSDVLWDGLHCGGSYLEGDEYNYLAQLVDSAGIHTAVETGAGETSIFLHRKGVDSVALEAQLGPWLKRAQEAGCRAVHVPFDEDQLMFSPEALDMVLRDMPAEIDLIFVDSPVGTRARSRILTQLLRRFRPRLVLFHDTHRDAANLYQYQLEHDLRLVDYLPSRRGMVLLSTAGHTEAQIPRTSRDVVVTEACWVVSVQTAPRTVTAGAQFTLNITIDNQGDHVLSSRHRNPIHVSYHWLNADGGVLIYDGARTELPFDLHPRHTATMTMRVTAPDSLGNVKLQLALVQETVGWFDARGNDSAPFIDMAIEAAEEPSKTVASLTIPSPTTFIDRESSRRAVLESLHIITTDIEMDRAFMEIYTRCKAHTITSLERMYSMWQAMRYISQSQIAGDIVECGVWMGGNCMLAALALLGFGDTQRRIWLYDTFAGMTRPSAEDLRHDGKDAESNWELHQTGEETSNWWSAPYEVVKGNVLSTGYPEDKLSLVKGKVEDTLPMHLPERIAVLRLDTDWYQSTRQEMVHLFPRLVPGGVLILDDYGWWKGSQQAVDEYLSQHGLHLLLSRIDSCGARMAIKLPYSA